VILGLAAVLGVYGGRNVLTVVGVSLGAWIMFSTLIDPIDRLRRRLSIPRSVLGMTIAHLGLGTAVIALSVVESFTVERDIALGNGQSAQVGGYEFRLLGTQPVEGPNYSAVRATVTVTRNGRLITTLYPEKREFWVQQQERTVAGIRNLYATDLFIALGDDLGAGRWSLRAQIRPLISLVWLGPILMALGGFLAISDRRYRAGRVPATQALPQGAKESVS
jgi:cytochrome c-type biogenesis protein CcmF